MKKFHLILFLLFFFIKIPTGFSQFESDESILTDMIPQSPESAKLGAYSPASVNHFTGGLNTSIPLFALEGQNVSVPVSLNYSSNGMRVNQISPWTGLGFNLNAGGVITREIRDQPDDAYTIRPAVNVCLFNLESFGTGWEPCEDCDWTDCEGGGNNTGSIITYVLEHDNIGYLDNGNLIDELYNQTTPYSVEQQIFMHGRMQVFTLDLDDDDPMVGDILVNRNGDELTLFRPNYPIYDTEPDVFSFNFLGNSGSFVFDKDGIPKLFSESDLKIDYVRDIEAEITCGLGVSSIFTGAITGFIITTPDGNKFYFEEKELSFGNSQGQKSNVGRYYDCNPPLQMPYRTDVDNVRAAYTSWYLTKIENHFGEEEFTFEYNDEYYVDHSQISQTLSTCPNGGGENGISTSSTVNSYANKKISRILCHRGSSYGQSIEFEAEHDRQDLYYPTAFNALIPSTGKTAKALTKISLLGGNQGLLREFNLTYDYFDKVDLASNCNTSSKPWVENHRNWLRLESIQEVGNLGESKPAHRFEYNSEPLPPRHSASQDFWGFYNRVRFENTIGNHLIPRTYAYLHGHPNDDDYCHVPDPTEPHPTIYAIYQRPTTLGGHLIASGTNRESDFIGTNAGVLSKITFPTGGYEEYTYGLHRFALKEFSDIHEGGGLRIESFANSEGNTKLFEYGYGDFGRVVGLPSFVTSVNHEYDCTFIRSNPTFGMEQVQGSFVGYERVVEISPGNGRTEYLFDYPVPYGTYTDDCQGLGECYSIPETINASGPQPCYSFAPFPPVPNFNWNRGQLLSSRTFHENGSLLSSVQNEYEIVDFEKINGIRATYTHGVVAGNFVFTVGINLWASFQATFVVTTQAFSEKTTRGKYYLLSGYKRLKQSISRLDGVYTTTDYKYAPDGAHHFVKETSFTNSDGKIFETKYHYAADGAPAGASGSEAAAVTAMNSQGMMGALLSAEQYVGGNLVGGTKTAYNTYTGTGTSDMILPHKIMLNEGGWDVKTTINNYDQNGMPLSITRKGWNPEIFTWNDYLINTKTFNDWTQSWDFNGNSYQLETFTDIDGQSVSYGYDGLQRLILTTARDGQVNSSVGYFFHSDNDSPAQGLNVVTGETTFSDAPNQENIQVFDGLGRFISNTGIHYDPEQENAVFDAAAYDGRGRNTLKSYMINTFSTLRYEKSPLDRLERKINPDQNFKEIVYECNDGGEVPGFGACQLYKQTVLDENGNPTTIFTDKAGRKVAVRDALDQLTTYTYEDDGDLILVSSPAGTFAYTYDQHHRVRSKSIPGGGTTLFTQYDPRDLLEKSKDAKGNSTTNHYDEYGQLTQSNTGLQSVKTKYEFNRIIEVEASTINPNGTPGVSTIQSYDYDEFGRVANQSMGALAGTDTYEFTYNAADNVLQSIRNHAGAHSFQMVDDHVYDHSGRLIQSWQKIGNQQSVLLNDISYSHRDEVTGKSLYSKNGGSSFLQGVGYGYNAMGWLETINGVELPYVEGKIPDCELPSGPYSFPEIHTQVDIETLIDIINGGGEVVIDGGDPCEDTPEPPCEGCPADCTPDCSAETIRLQTNYINQYWANLKKRRTAPNLPTNLNLVEFCDGTTLYVLDDEMADIPGEVAVINVVFLDYKLIYEVICDGETQHVSANYLLNLRKTCDEFIVSGGNCEVKQSTVKETCTYRMELRRFRNKALRNSRDIEVYYDKVVSRLCNDDYEDEFIKEEKVHTFQSQKSWIIRNRQSEDIYDETYRLKEGGYIKSLKVQTFNPDGYLDINLDPNHVLAIYPGLDADFNPEHLRWQVGQSANLRMEKAIAKVVDEAIAQWAIQNQYEPEDVLYEFSADIKDAGTYNTTGTFQLEFMEFNIKEKPGISVCSPKAGVTYVTARDPKISVTYTSIPEKGPNWNTSHRLHNYELTECGYVSLVHFVSFEYDDECGSIVSRLNVELAPNEPGTEWSYSPKVECTKEVTKYTMNCGPTIQVCLGGRCTDCEKTDGPTIVVNPEVDPCNPTPPTCTDEEAQAQSTALANILIEMGNLDVEDMQFPTTLVQILLCDGTTAYVLEDFLYLYSTELTNYTIIQTITITESTEIFTVTVFPENDLFGMRLDYYNGSDQLQAEPYKNGNVSWMKWKVGNQAVQQYGFRYDELDRIKNAYYQAQYITPGNIGGNPTLNLETIHQNRYNLYDVGYDGAGNILNLKRNGFIDCNQGLIDDLGYGAYNNNQLSGVRDAADAAHGFKNGMTTYDYDANGNLTHDTGKGIDKIHYNFLNLPRQINTVQGDMNIWYDANGTKQRKEVTGAGGYTKEYANGVEYKDGELEAIYTGDGRIIFEIIEDEDTQTSMPRYRYEFTLSDHLGNARVTFSDLDDDGFITLADNPETDDVEEPVEMLQENHYYPFGMNMEGGWTPQVGPDNQYQYNGSKNIKGSGSGKSFDGPTPGDAASYSQGMEKTQELGLDVNMAFYRTFDPAIGRFWNVDPMAEGFYNWSVYTGNLDNPIRYADPEGDCPICPYLLGAAGGGALDYVAQVGFNMYDGKGWSSFTDIDGESIAISVAAGATGVGFAQHGNKLMTLIKGGTKLDDAASAGLKATTALADDIGSTGLKGITKGAITLSDDVFDSVIKQTIKDGGDITRGAQQILKGPLDKSVKATVNSLVKLQQNLNDKLLKNTIFNEEARVLQSQITDDFLKLIN